MLKTVIESGWGIFPVILCGTIAVILATAFAISVRREILPLFATFWIATLLAGCLGFVKGVNTTIDYIAKLPAFDTSIMANGVREAAGNIVVAIMLAMLAVLLSGVGGFRMAWRTATRGA